MVNTTNPYSTQSVTAPINHDMNVSAQVKRYKDEERFHKAPRIVPFDFDASKEILSQMYENLLIFRKSLSSAENNSQINKNVLAAITQIVDNIGEEILVKIPEQLDKVSF